MLWWQELAKLGRNRSTSAKCGRIEVSKDICDLRNISGYGLFAPSTSEFHGPSCPCSCADWQVDVAAPMAAIGGAAAAHAVAASDATAAAHVVAAPQQGAWVAVWSIAQRGAAPRLSPPKTANT